MYGERVRGPVLTENLKFLALKFEEKEKLERLHGWRSKKWTLIVAWKYENHQN